MTADLSAPFRGQTLPELAWGPPDLGSKPGSANGSRGALGKCPSFSGPRLPQLKREVEARGQLPCLWRSPSPQRNEAHHHFPRAEPAGTALLKWKNTEPCRPALPSPVEERPAAGLMG